jgi:hypothetical protein
MDRRSFLHRTGYAVVSLRLLRDRKLSSCSPNESSDGGDIARPSSQPLRSVAVAAPLPVADNEGDTWVAAWGDDGNLYSPSDDTSGFHKAANSNIAFNRIGGADPRSLRGTTVNVMKEYGKGAEEGPDHCTWKSSGCTFLDGALYWVVARHRYGTESGDPHRRQTAQNASIIKSKDHGLTWTRSAIENYNHPMFPGRRFATPYFIEYGRSQADVDGARTYVYAVSNNGFWDCGDDMILGRVLRSKLPALNGAHWEFFTGGDGMRPSTWTRRADEATPVVQQPGKLGMTGAVYLPDHGRYMMINWYYPLGGGRMQGAATHTVWEFYESPHPWGPWTQIATHDWSPQGYYSPEICPKFQSKERVFVFTAGNWDDPKDYRLTVVPIEFRF